MSCCENNQETLGSCAPGEKNHHHGKSTIIVLLLISLVTNLAIGYYLTMGGPQSPSNVDTIANAVMVKYLDNEYAKSGGKENYDLLAQAQRFQMQDQIPQIKQFIASK